MNLFYLLIIISIFISSCSQLLLKESAMKDHKSLIAEYINWRVMLAYLIFLGAIFVNILGYKNGVQVKDTPILEALGYVFVPMLSHIYFKEEIDKRTLFSIIIIIIGLIVFYI